MEYIPGNNLEEEQAINGIPTTKDIYKVARQLCAAIGEIHRLHVVHRDIKPKNIMLMTQENIIKLTDFGIAKRLNESVSNLTKDGLIVGTPIYMAPELFIGEEPSVASDIYSFGVTIYQYATGSPPFSAPNNWELAKKHTNDAPKSLCALNSELHSAFDEFIVDYCLAKDPRERPESMQEISSILKELESINSK
jgi:serine/threonine protein kinase